MQENHPPSPENDPEELLDEIDDTLAKIKGSTDSFFRRKLITWCIRWTLTVILYVWLWNKFWWIKWTLLLTIPLGLYSLYVILNFRKKIDDKLSDTGKTIKNI